MEIPGRDLSYRASVVHVWMVVTRHVDSVFWKECHGLSAVEKELPKVFRRFGFLWETTCHPNDGNGLVPSSGFDW